MNKKGDIQQNEELEEAKETGVFDDKDEKLEKRVSELEEQVKRVLADYQNLEKRSREERRDWIRVANREILLRLLPVLDTLMLASKHSEDKSLHISITQFADALKSEGVTRIETIGKSFDPNTMEAVGTAAGKENIVVEEARAGYMMQEKLLRPAQVIVGKEN